MGILRVSRRSKQLFYIDGCSCGWWKGKRLPKGQANRKAAQCFMARTAFFLWGQGLSQAGFCALYCKFAHKKGFMWITLWKIWQIAQQNPEFLIAFANWNREKKEYNKSIEIVKLVTSKTLPKLLKQEKAHSCTKPCSNAERAEALARGQMPLNHGNKNEEERSQ